MLETLSTMSMATGLLVFDKSWKAPAMIQPFVYRTLYNDESGMPFV
jgi:hypothetical protein